ncbi:MAG: hypothetical protein E7637_03890 [Ruminococcaceae bacterium]|nr:hypothetical protein [Oscillospiraceae bacterium]
MKAYFISLLAAALALAAVGILFPEGDGGGISKHLRLTAALVWLCVLISPVCGAIQSVRDRWNNLFSLSFSKEEAKKDYQDRFDEALQNASAEYFCDMLTQTLEAEFEITPGELRCHVSWETENGELTPSKITLLLSGKAIWKSPHELEDFVTNLVGCNCVTAIE